MWNLDMVQLRTVGLAGAAFVAFFCQFIPASAGIIQNGDFSQSGTGTDPFAYWSTDTFFGFSAPGDGDGSTTGFASFTVTGGGNEVQLSQMLQGTPATLAFDIAFLSTDDGSSTGSVIAYDSFVASLIDYSVPDFQPFYFMDSEGIEIIEPGVSVSASFLRDGYSWRQVVLDFSSLPLRDYTLDFWLAGGDDAMTTTVYIDNVVAVQQQPTVVPEPASLVLWTLLGTAMLPIGYRRHRRRMRCEAGVTTAN